MERLVLYNDNIRRSPPLCTAQSPEPTIKPPIAWVVYVYHDGIQIIVPEVRRDPREAKSGGGEEVTPEAYNHET